jgi:hypothetical protein
MHSEGIINPLRGFENDRWEYVFYNNMTSTRSTFKPNQKPLERLPGNIRLKDWLIMTINLSDGSKGFFEPGYPFTKMHDHI